MTIVSFLCEGIIFLLDLKKCDNKCINCLSGFFFHLLSTICLIINFCMWYLDFEQVQIFTTLKTKIYPSIDDRYPKITNKKDTYTLIFYWISLYSCICMFIQFIFNAFEKKCCCCCCCCCKDMNSEEFEKGVKWGYLIADIMIVLATFAILMPYLF